MRRTGQTKTALPPAARRHIGASRIAHTRDDACNNNYSYSYSYNCNCNCNYRRKSRLLFCIGLFLLLAALAIPHVHFLILLARTDAPHAQQMHIIGGADWPTYAFLYRQALCQTFLGTPWPFLCLHTGIGILLVAAILRRKAA